MVVPQVNILLMYVLYAFHTKNSKGGEGFKSNFLMSNSWESSFFHSSKKYGFSSFSICPCLCLLCPGSSALGSPLWLVFSHDLIPREGSNPWTFLFARTFSSTLKHPQVFLYSIHLTSLLPVFLLLLQPNVLAEFSRVTLLHSPTHA